MSDIKKARVTKYLEGIMDKEEIDKIQFYRGK